MGVCVAPEAPRCLGSHPGTAALVLRPHPWDHSRTSSQAAQVAVAGLALGCTHEAVWFCIPREGRLRAQGQPAEPQDAITFCRQAAHITPALPGAVCFNPNHGRWHRGGAECAFTGSPCDRRRQGLLRRGPCLTESTVLSLVALSTGAGVATDAVLTHTVVLAGA